jgi:transketolase
VMLGQDGPTHQPIEHLASLRAIPNLTVIRPADANETAVAWKIALQRREGPTALVFTRQKLPVIDRTACAPADGVAKGAYVLIDPPDRKPEMILIATGSEVHPSLEACKVLTEKGIAVRVVSMPSWELFEAQPLEYRQEVLPPDVTARLTIEAAASFGWRRYAGPGGKIIGIDRFGASAPGEVNQQKFGFTAERVIAEAQDFSAMRETAAR